MWFIQSWIMAFMAGGCYAIAHENMPDKTHPLFWTIFITTLIVCFILIKIYPQLVLSHFLVGRKRYEDEDHRKRMHRIKIIQGLCNKNMAKAEIGKAYPRKEHVVVSYDDLLRIWDNAAKIQYSE